MLCPLACHLDAGAVAELQQRIADTSVQFYVLWFRTRFSYTGTPPVTAIELENHEGMIEDTDTDLDAATVASPPYRHNLNIGKGTVNWCKESHDTCHVKFTCNVLFERNDGSESTLIDWNFAKSHVHSLYERHPSTSSAATEGITRKTGQTTIKTTFRITVPQPSSSNTTAPPAPDPLCPWWCVVLLIALAAVAIISLVFLAVCIIPKIRKRRLTKMESLAVTSKSSVTIKNHVPHPNRGDSFYDVVRAVVDNFVDKSVPKKLRRGLAESSTSGRSSGTSATSWTMTTSGASDVTGTSKASSGASGSTDASGKS